MRTRFHFLAALLLASTAMAKDVHVAVRATDRMHYDVRAFEAATGDQVVLTLENAGRQPRHLSGYNLVVLRPGTDPEAFARDALHARDTDFIPEQRRADIVVHTRLLGPGERDEIRFTAGPPGAYPFLCSFPGHHVRMSGVMTVK